MFDLENAIKAWRLLLAANGIKCPVTLDELESHLRDDVEELVRSGKPLEDAFRLAVVRMGRTVAIAEEFSKVQRGSVERRPKYLLTFSLASSGLILLSAISALLMGHIDSVAQVLVCLAVFFVATYLAILPFGYRKLPSLQKPGVQKAIVVATLFVSVWVVLALLHALGVVRLFLPEFLTAFFWSLVPAIFATVLAYEPLQAET